ncbi:MAG: ATPase [Eubacteriales bacterium]|nr:ATPase [Eubacteriales bacterium]
MDKVIKQISDIESAAAAVMDAANERKQTFAAEMAEKTAAFDRELDARAEQKIRQLQQRMEADMKARLAKQKADAEALLAQMEKNYADHHKEYVQKLFEALVKE